MAGITSDPSNMASQTLPERGNLGEHTTYEKDNAVGTKPTPKASEHINKPCDSVDLVHHRGNKVCNVELVPVRKRKLHNVLTRMKDKRLHGPLAVMRRCMIEDIKVKVITRNYKHVRGICTGYILAFDKHWNLALKDVDEVYKNPLPKPTAKRKKRQRKTKEKNLSEAVPDGKDLLQNEKPRNPTSKPESAADLLSSDFALTDSSSTEDDVDSCKELAGKVPGSMEMLREKRRAILERLQQLSCAQNPTSEYGEDEMGEVKRRSRIDLTEEKLDRVSRDERRSSASSSTGSRDMKRLRTVRAKESHEQNQRRGSRNDDSDLSLRDGGLKDAECGIVQKDLHRKKSSAQSQTKLKGTSSRHQEPVCPVMHNTEREDPENLPQNNPQDCDSQQMYQSWLVRHVNQLFIRGDNVVLVSINET